jgi:hypothetical protein
VGALSCCLAFVLFDITAVQLTLNKNYGKRYLAE